MTSPAEDTGSKKNVFVGNTHVITIGLDAVIVAVTENDPLVLTVKRTAHALTQKSTSKLASLPFGPFEPDNHRTLEIGMRTWVAKQTGLPLGYVEQLYTFGDRYRDPRELQGGPRVVTVGYLALTQKDQPSGSGEAEWLNWYAFFPWEDWRSGKPVIIEDAILKLLHQWAGSDKQRLERIILSFGDTEAGWDPDLVLERYELLYEAGLVYEAHRDFDQRFDLIRDEEPVSRDSETMTSLRSQATRMGEPMAHDHRRILATAMSRIRGKLKYRPVVFELLPERFTLLRLQQVVESLSGVGLHKQNFRRLVLNTGLVEQTDGVVSHHRGRPAALFRFRREVIRERPAPGVGLPSSRN